MDSFYIDTAKFDSFIDDLTSRFAEDNQKFPVDREYFAEQFAYYVDKPISQDEFSACIDRAIDRCFNDTVLELCKKGLVNPTLDENGEFMFVPTDLGKIVAKKLGELDL